MVYQATILSQTDAWSHLVPTPENLTAIILGTDALEGQRPFETADLRVEATAEWENTLRQMSHIGATDSGIISLGNNGKPTRLQDDPDDTILFQ